MKAGACFYTIWPGAFCFVRLLSYLLLLTNRSCCARVSEDVVRRLRVKLSVDAANLLRIVAGHYFLSVEYDVHYLYMILIATNVPPGTSLLMVERNDEVP